MKNFIRKLYIFIMKRITSVGRTLYRRFKSLKLKNRTPSIIANNCFGTFVYYDMALKYFSPTINLFITTEDFITFVNNLKGFISSDVTEINDSSIDYPIGKICYADKEVKLHFMHYKSFEQARKKWNERKLRIDFSNIYIIWLEPHNTPELNEQFLKIPFKNKMYITDKAFSDDKSIITHPIFNQPGYQNGDILYYKKFSIKRPMDSIDYISFLNQR